MGAAHKEMCLRAEALFASFVQPSDRPTPGEIRKAVAGALARFGPRGCAERTASEYGADPPSAVARMRWAVTAVQAAFAPPLHGHQEQPRPAARAPAARAPAARSIGGVRAGAARRRSLRA